MLREITTILSGFTYLEAPRWHGDRLWVSDLYTQQVISCREDGSDIRVEMELDVPPAGIDWLPDGRLLVAATARQELLRREHDGTVTTHADLSSLATSWINDFAVDAQGRAFIGHFGFDLFDDQPIRPATLIRVDPDGSSQVVADDLYFPNGSVITPDGRLLVCETHGNRVSSFAIERDGSLSDRSEWAFGPLGSARELNASFAAADVAPDGCALDSEGALWIADIAHDRVIRAREDGNIVDEIDPGTGVFACALGGSDGKTLFMCTAPDPDRELRTAERLGEIRVARVSVPSATA